MTIKVGFDYDEPLFPWYDYAHHVSVAAGLTTLDQDPPTMWDPTTVYGRTLDEWYEVLMKEARKGSKGMYAWPLKPGVVSDMYRLKNRGMEIHLVTARGQFGTEGELIKRLTWDQIHRERVPYDSLTFTEDKEETIRRLDLDYYLDDREKYFHEARRAGASPYLLDERWNQDFSVHYTRRVFTTRQYIDKIIKMHENPTGRRIFEGRFCV